jgi:methyl-accepting chemotaxis protein
LEDLGKGNCDLTRRVSENVHKEVGEAGIWLNVFIARMEEMVQQVANRAQLIGESANALSEIIGDTANDATKQQGQASRIQAGMNEITKAFQSMSDSTQEAALHACLAEQNARSGGQTVGSTVQTIEELLQSNQETSSRIEELGRSSDAIGKIIGVIDEIAGQTNLLALNASIEAARAGEHGRGFAVVAGEVRRLAERTGSATKEIDSTVRSIQKGTQEAVEAMRASMTRVQSGVDSARSAGEVLVSIIDGTESLQRMVEQIAESAIAEPDSTQSLSGDLDEIASDLQRATLGSGQAGDACRNLAQLAGNLASVVGAFKV